MNVYRPTVWVPCRFNVPERVQFHSILVARHFLLFKSPLRQFDLMGEKVTAGHIMSQTKLSPQGSKTLARLPVASVTVIDLDNPVVVRVAGKVWDAISGHFILEIDFGHWRTVIM